VNAPAPSPSPTGARSSVALGSVIFASRWLQAPLYLGLIVAQAIYVVVFLIDLWHLAQDVFTDITHLNESTIMLAVLGLIDVVMIANLLIMVIMGGYEIKVKLAISIISISSIHLLRTFIEVGDLGSTTSGESVTGETYTSEGVFWQVVIHLAFIVSALALAWIDKISHQAAEPTTAAPVAAEPVPAADKAVESA
jgi:uncharacterized membrane protein YqhA